MYSDYLNFQFSGDYILSVQTNIETSYSAMDSLLNYFITLSIDSSVSRETDRIGTWIGFSRIYIPENLVGENSFLFFKVADMPIYSPEHGFSSLAHPEIGGRFITLNPNIVLLPLDVYKEVIKRIAYIKWNGWTFKSLDYLCTLAGVDCEFSFDSEGDVIVTYEELIDPLYIYLFGIILNMFQTLPRVTIQIA